MELFKQIFLDKVNSEMFFVIRTLPFFVVEHYKVVDGKPNLPKDRILKIFSDETSFLKFSRKSGLTHVGEGDVSHCGFDFPFGIDEVPETKIIRAWSSLASYCSELSIVNFEGGYMNKDMMKYLNFLQERIKYWLGIFNTFVQADVRVIEPEKKIFADDPVEAI